MRRYVALLAGAAAVLATGGILASRVPVASDRVLRTVAFDRVPTLVLADAPAGRIVAVTDANRWAGPGGAGSIAEAHVLADDGREITAIPIGPRPSHALVDPRTGHIFVMTAGLPGAAPSFFSSGIYLSALDPLQAEVLHTTAIPSLPASGGTSPGRRGFGGRPPVTSGPPPPPWFMAYRTATSLNSVGALALDPATRRLFVASGGGGGGFGGGGFLAATGPAQITVLDADSLSIIRSVRMPSGVSALAVDPARARLYAIDRTGTLSVLDVRTLGRVGTRRISGGAAQIAVDTRAGRVFVLDAVAGTVTTIDGASGAVVGVASVAGGASGIQVDERLGRVFVESIGASGFGLVRAGPGSVGMLDASSGRVLRMIPVQPLPFGAALDATHHRLFVSGFDPGATGGSGRVQVLDTARGTLLRTIAVPTSPFSLAVDPRKEQLAVAGSGIDAQSPNNWSDAVDGVSHMLDPATPTPMPTAPAGGTAAQGVVSVVKAVN